MIFSLLRFFALSGSRTTWQLAKIKRQTSYAELQTLLKELITAQGNRLRNLRFLNDDLKRLSELRDLKREKIGLTVAEEDKGPVETIEELEARDRDYDEMMRLYNEYCDSDGLDAVIKKQEVIHSDNSLQSKLELLLSTYDSSRVMHRVRVSTEVLFPLSFGVIALVSAAYRWL